MIHENTFLSKFLTIYSQSERSTGGTRGYDPKTYVETKLDGQLIPRIFDPKTKLVILSGNAGDGKTAFIQHFEAKAQGVSASFTKKTDNGCLFTLNGTAYETLYDGSQDFEGTENDAVLASFFQPFEGDKSPTGSMTKIIAINEGKLRDFILFKPQYKWLGRQVHHYLDYEGFKPHESLVFVNLNLRSVVDNQSDGTSIMDLLIDRFLDTDSTEGFWSACAPHLCSYSERCYVKYNVDTFNDPVKGQEVQKRLKTLMIAVHFRKIRHITMRDLRSILSLVLFNKYTCGQLQRDLEEKRPVIERFYYNTVFSGRERDRIAQLLADTDVAAVTNPRLDNFIHFHAPDSPEMQNLFIQPMSGGSDVEFLAQLYKNRPEGTQDSDSSRQANARLYHASIRRKLFFEGDENKLTAAGLPTWRELLPYRQFERFLKVIESRADSAHDLRDEITLAISKSERIYNETVGKENLCLRSMSAKRNSTKAFYGFPASDFEVVVKDIGTQSDYLEYLPNSIFYRHADKSVELEIPLDLFEVLCRIFDGYAPTSSEIRTFFLNLDMFKRRVTSKRADRVFLTEDDVHLYEIRSDHANRLVMTQIGG